MLFVKPLTSTSGSTRRMTASFRDSLIGEGLFLYLIFWSCEMVDKYNDQFLALDKGIMSIADFIEKV